MTCPYCSSSQTRRITSERRVLQAYDHKIITLAQIYYCDNCQDLFQRCVTTTDRATPLARDIAKRIASSHGLKFVTDAEEKSEPSTPKCTCQSSTPTETTSTSKTYKHKTTPEEFWDLARLRGLV